MIRTFYYTVAGISMVVLGTSLFHLYENDTFSNETIKKFQKVIYFTMFEIVIDTLFEIVSGNPNTSRILLYVIKITEFIASPILMVLVLDILIKNKTSQKKQKLLKVKIFLEIIFFVNLFFQIISLYGNHIFYIDENNLYQRGKFIPVYIGILVLSIGVMIYGIIMYSNSTQSIMKLTILGFSVILSIGLVLRAIFKETNFDWLCVSIAILLFLLYYANITLRIDPLTQLMNRTVFSIATERIDYTTVVIAIDANNFKEINDSYGHECGDKTLRILGKLILKTYGEYAYCYRSGGDEFCVILKPNVFEMLIDQTPNSDAYAMSRELMKKLDEAILEQEAKEEDNIYLKYGVSHGYGIYYYPPDYPSMRRKMSFEQVLKLADKRMYRDKRNFKKKLKDKKIIP